MRTLDDAILFAAQVHHGQRDRYNKPYILHPLRVMMRMTDGGDEDTMMAAILHDVIEDSDYTLDDLHTMGYPEAVVKAVDALTKREGEAYEHLIKRALKNPIARRVKRADLEDNMDVRRIPADRLDSDTAARLKKYRRAWQRIMAKLR